MNEHERTKLNDKEKAMMKTMLQNTRHIDEIFSWKKEQDKKIENISDIIEEHALELKRLDSRITYVAEKVKTLGRKFLSFTKQAWASRIGKVFIVVAIVVLLANNVITHEDISLLQWLL